MTSILVLLPRSYCTDVSQLALGLIATNVGEGVKGARISKTTVRYHIVTLLTRMVEYKLLGTSTLLSAWSGEDDESIT